MLCPCILHTIYPPYIKSAILGEFCNCILKAPDTLQQHSHLTA